MTPIIARVFTAALVAIAAFSCIRSSPARAADPTGTWQTEDGRARVRTERCGADPSRLCGYIVWGSKPLDEDGKPKIDKHNPDPTRKARPQLGHQMLLGLTRNGDGRHEGKIYDGDSGKSYDVEVWSDQSSALSVKGCMLVFCSSQSWKRVTDVVPGQLQGATDTPGGPRSDPEWAAKPAATGAVPSHKARPGQGQSTQPH